jgi:hypothetical protein
VCGSGTLAAHLPPWAVSTFASMPTGGQSSVAHLPVFPHTPLFAVVGWCLPQQTAAQNLYSRLALALLAFAVVFSVMSSPPKLLRRDGWVAELPPTASSYDQGVQDLGHTEPEGVWTVPVSTACPRATRATA